MPVYYYRFPDGTVEEVAHSIHDDPHSELEHPDTKEILPVIRVPAPPTVILKGSGFAKNDRKKK